MNKHVFALILAVLVWANCGAIMGIGPLFVSMETTMVVHAIGGPLGAAVAVDVAARHRPGALIAESGFTSAPDVGARHYPFLPVRLLARNHFDNLSRIAEVQAPVLVIHSRTDGIIPFSHGQQLFDAASSAKSFLEIKGGHNDGFFVTGSRYSEGIDAFLDQYISE